MKMEVDEENAEPLQKGQRSTTSNGEKGQGKGKGRKGQGKKQNIKEELHTRFKDATPKPCPSSSYVTKTAFSVWPWRRTSTFF